MKPIEVMDFIAERDALNPSDQVALRRHYYEMLLTTCLQALVNHDEPSVFVRCNAKPDGFWFHRMTEEYGWQAGSPVVQADSIRNLLLKLPGTAKGLQVWEEQEPAISNVGATVPGFPVLHSPVGNST